MPVIAVYQDYVHNNGSLVMVLHACGCQINFVDAYHIIRHGIDADALVMPGGADLYYCEKLNGAGNDAIRAFVENGGGYLGICAGAYYGCTSLDWDNGQITGKRELALIDAHAKGPVFDYIQDQDLNKSWYSAPDLHHEGQTFKTLYAAGPVFDVKDKDTEILATYDGNQPAVIAKGKVVLSSPHIECFGNYFSHGRYMHRTADPVYERKIAETLMASVDQQKKFFAFILERLISTP